MNLKSLVLGCAFAAGLSAASAHAAIVNPSFETGVFAPDWTVNTAPDGAAGIVGGSVDFAANPFSATDGLLFAELLGGSTEDYTTIEQAFSLSSAALVTFDAAFLGYDDENHDDDGYVRIVGFSTFEPFTASIGLSGPFANFPASPDGVPNSPGYVPPGTWGHYSVLLAAGDYVFQAGVRNVGDTVDADNPYDASYSSRLLVDNIGVTTAPVPEPGVWALMIVGFGAAGAMVRANRRRLAA